MSENIFSILEKKPVSEKKRGFTFKNKWRKTNAIRYNI